MPDQHHVTEPGLGTNLRKPSMCKGQHRTAPHNDPSSRVNQAWSGRTEDGYSNFKCPVCGEPVRYCRVRGNRSPLIECSNRRCKWTADELISEKRIISEEQKPKAISTRQWYQSSTKAVS